MSLENLELLESKEDSNKQKIGDILKGHRSLIERTNNGKARTISATIHTHTYVYIYS